jgi:methionyl-tRNA synthetase
MKIQLKTAKVLTAERVPKSEKLLKLQVSLGEGTEQRQIVAGIGKTYTPEALIGKTIIIVANLKPAKLMGIESQGMVLAAGDNEVRGLATILEEVDPGTKVKGALRLPQSDCLFLWCRPDSPLLPRNPAEKFND